MRITSSQINQEFARQNSGVALLYFLTFSHPELPDDIRFVNDNVDYTRGGKEWAGIPFEISFLTDNEQPPQCKIRFENISRRIGGYIRSIDTALRLKVEILSSLDFDLDQTPRLEIGTAVVEYTASNLVLVDATVNGIEINATLKSWFEYAREPWPVLKVTQDRFPALFR